jgi:hypothetical protein
VSRVGSAPEAVAAVPGLDRAWRADPAALAALVLLWLAMAAIAGPVGEFPINDDWAYAYSVRALVEEHELRFSGWTATNLLTQTLWGGLFALPFGFSFTALRLSTLVLGLVGVLATYGLLRELRAAPALAFLGALVVAANPIYFALSLSFMNDVPFAAIATLSLYCLLRGLGRGSGLLLAAGFALAALAILARQVGLCLPLAFACACLARRGFSARTLALAGLPVVLGLALQLGYQRWLALTLREPDKYGNQIATLMGEARRGLGHLFEIAAKISVHSLLYLGLFLAPLLLVAAIGCWRRWRPGGRLGFALAAAGGAGLLAAAVLRLGLRMPVRGNILTEYGIGPLILKRVDLVPLPGAAWQAATIVAIAGGGLVLAFLGLLLFRLVQALLAGRLAEHWDLVFVAAAAAVYTAPILLLGLGPFGFYDRYLLFLLPLGGGLAVILLRDVPLPPPAVLLGLGLIAAMAAFSTAASRDYMELQRARWQALDALTGAGILPNEIDGGFEFNAWHLYRDDYADWLTEPEKSWYWVDRDTFAVTFAPVDGYAELDRRTVRRWLGPPATLHVLRRAPEPETGS